MVQSQCNTTSCAWHQSMLRTLLILHAPYCTSLGSRLHAVRLIYNDTYNYTWPTLNVQDATVLQRATSGKKFQIITCLGICKSLHPLSTVYPWLRQLVKHTSSQLGPGARVLEQAVWPSAQMSCICYLGVSRIFLTAAAAAAAAACCCTTCGLLLALCRQFFWNLPYLSEGCCEQTGAGLVDGWRRLHCGILVSIASCRPVISLQAFYPYI